MEPEREKFRGPWDRLPACHDSSVPSRVHSLLGSLHVQSPDVSVRAADPYTSENFECLFAIAARLALSALLSGNIPSRPHCDEQPLGLPVLKCLKVGDNSH